MAEVNTEQCNRSMERVHIRVDTVEKITASIETSAKNIEKCVYDIHKILYGNGSDGLVTKVSINEQKINGVFWFGSVIIIALIGTLVGLLFKR